MIKGKDRDETIRLTAEALGCGLDQAAVIVAFELGETTGDRIDLAAGGIDQNADEDETEKSES